MGFAPQESSDICILIFQQILVCNHMLLHRSTAPCEFYNSIAFDPRRYPDSLLLFQLTNLMFES